MILLNIICCACNICPRAVLGKQNMTSLLLLSGRTVLSLNNVFLVIVIFIVIEIIESNMYMLLNRVANVRRSHVILTIQNTHVFSKKKLDSGRKTNSCVVHTLCSEKTVKCIYPSLVSSFICMFHLLMKFRQLRVNSCQPCFFRAYGTDTRPSVS